MKLKLYLGALVCLTFSPFLSAQDCTVFAGRDTFVCGFSYNLVANPSDGTWSVICNEENDIVDFFEINDTLTSVTVVACGNYEFVYELLDVDTLLVVDTMSTDSIPIIEIVFDTVCFVTDTVQVNFENPSIVEYDVATNVELAFDLGACPTNDTVNCNNVYNSNNDAAPDPLWTFTSIGLCNSTLLTPEAIDVNDCEAEQILFQSTNSTGIVMDTFTIFQSEFLQLDPITGEILVNEFADVLGAVENSIVERGLELCPVPERCDNSPEWCKDTIFDTTMLVVPIRISGEWLMYPEENVEIPLQDTTQFILEDSTYIVLAQPAADLYDASFAFFQITFENDTIPFLNFEGLEFQWTEEWGLDTTIEVVSRVRDTCCFSGINFTTQVMNEVDPPVYDCPPFQIVFTDKLEAIPTIINCTDTSYAVQIEINGGIPPYSYFGTEGVIEDSIFTSIEIPLGMAYDVAFFDQDSCSTSKLGTGCSCVDIQIAAADSIELNCVTGCTVVDVSATSNLSNGDLEFNWINPDGEFMSMGTTALVCDTGQFILVVRETNSNCTKTKPIQVFSNQPFADVTMENRVTCDQPLVSLAGADMSVGSNISYLWTGPGIDSLNAFELSPEVVEAGIYQIIVTNLDNSCTDTATMEVLIDTIPSVADAGPDQQFGCNTAQLMIGGDNTDIAFGDIHWDGPGISPIGASLPFPLIDEPGIFIMTNTNPQNGCFTVDTVNIFPYDSIKFEVEVLEPSCWNNPSGVVVFSNVTGGRPPYSYSSNNSFFTPDSIQANVPIGTRTMTISDLIGCRESIVVEVGEIPPIEAAFETEYHTCGPVPVALDVTVDLAPFEATYRWSDDTIGPIRTLLEAGDYWVDITTKCESIRTDILLVDDSDFEQNFTVPNIFSPNNDGTNDLFRPLTNLNVIDYQLQIYNRWGQRFFETDNIDEAWDGTVNGNSSPGDIYVYILKARLAICDGMDRDILLKGDLTLMR